MLTQDTKVKIKLSDDLHIKGTVQRSNDVGLDIIDEKGNRVFMPWFSVVKVVEDSEASW